MARIELAQVGHSYGTEAAGWALSPLSMTWEDGRAYALLGPSGCGKTTLLNIISGLLRPRQGRVLLGGKDVTQLPPQARNIAQVFQFPVTYDTMSVFDNLAFPLRNRGWKRAETQRRVQEVAELLELTADLPRRASALPAYTKQKVALGRGLVRPDVAAVLLDEPLTAVDPQLKWLLRRTLKQIHMQLAIPFIYVTHDQTEALTFADQVVVMTEGQVVQTGTPRELFERPAHTFVGDFIGNPGMNLLACTIQDGAARVGQRQVALPAGAPGAAGGEAARSGWASVPSSWSVAPRSSRTAIPPSWCRSGRWARTPWWRSGWKGSRCGPSCAGSAAWWPARDGCGCRANT